MLDFRYLELYLEENKISHFQLEMCLCKKKSELANNLQNYGLFIYQADSLMGKHVGSFNFFSCTDVSSTPKFPLDLQFAVPSGENAGDACSGRGEGFCVPKPKKVPKKKSVFPP